MDAIRDHVLAVNGYQRHNDAETDEVNEDRQENDEQRWFAFHVYNEWEF